MSDDPFFAGEGDIDAARALVAQAASSTSAELFTYAGDHHLFTDDSLESHDPTATALVIERVLARSSIASTVTNPTSRRRGRPRERAELHDQATRPDDVGCVRRPGRGQRRRLRRVLVHGLPSGGRHPRRRSTTATGCASTTGSAPAPPTRRSCSTVTTASGGASSDPPTSCRASRAAASTSRPGADRPTGASPAATSGKGHRRQGVATAALTGALDLIAGLGGGRVEGYPEPAGAVPAGFLFNGALSTYEAAGFERDRMIGKHRWVVSRRVDPDG
jgi:hypothetical protein